MLQKQNKFKDFFNLLFQLMGHSTEMSTCMVWQYVLKCIYVSNI